MVKWILIEILAEPAESSRGRHNPRVVKRKMSNFPTKSRSTARAAPSRSLRYDEHIVIVAPPEPIAPTTMAGRQRAVPTTRQTQPAQTNHQTFWQTHVQAWRASGLRRAVYCQQQNLSPRAFNAAVARLRQILRPDPKSAANSAQVNCIGAKRNTVVIFPRSGGHLSKLGMIRAEVMDGEYSTGIHG